MEMKVQVPFQDILTLVKALTPAQKSRLRKELAITKVKTKRHSALTEKLLHGPVYTEKQIKTIEDNRKSIARWRTKS